MRQTDGIVRVRTAALYMRLLQALTGAHRLRAPAAPATARTHELRLATAYTALAVETSDRIQADLLRPRLGVLFDSDDTYDPLGNIDLIWATADAAGLALASGSTNETAARLQSAADQLYAFYRKSLPDTVDEAHRLVRAQARPGPVTARDDFRAFIPVQQRRIAYRLRDQQPAGILEAANALSALIRLTPLMPPDSGVSERAGDLFLDLAISFDRDDGWLRDRLTYTADEVATLLRALRLAAFHGQPPIERRYARDLLVAAWDALVNRSGLLRGAPPGRADGVALNPGSSTWTTRPTATPPSPSTLSRSSPAP